MKLTKRIQLGALAGLGCAALLSGTVLADGHGHGDGHGHEEKLTGVYHDRHEVMEGYRDFAKATGAMLQGKTEFDLATVQTGASSIAASSGDALLALFPEGSNEGKSEALDKIWEDWDGFTAAANLLQTKAEALAAAEDQAAVGAGFGALMQTCKGCHDNYRMKTN